MTAPLTVYYRVTPRTNGKGRPAWFSKRAALGSLLLSSQESGTPCRFVYLSDGGVPRELRDQVAASGEVVPITGGSAAASLRRMLDVVGERHAADRDGLLWFAEDDYVYRPDAVARLVAAERAIPDADFFSLYTPRNEIWHAAHPSQPATRGPEEERLVGDLRWLRAYDANSTFGMRAAVVAEDLRVLKATTWAGAPFDHVAVLLTSGLRPFSWRHVLSDLYLRPTGRAVAGAVARPAARVALNAVSVARPRSRSWFAPEQDLITHAEEGYLSPDWDWGSHATLLAAR